MKINISRSFVISILPILFYLCNLYRMLGNSAVLYQIVLIIAGILGILILIVVAKKNILFVFLLYILTLILNWLIIGNISINDIVQSTLLFGISVIMLVYPWTHRQAMVLFLVTCVIFCIKMYMGIDTRSILTSSANYISILLLLSVSFYYIALDVEERQLRIVDLLPAIFCFGLSVWAQGRGGILSTGILLILVSLIYMRNVTSKNLKRVVILAIMLLSLILLLIVLNINVFNQFMDLGKWETRGMDNSAREVIWKSYFMKMKESLKYILLGAPLDEIFIIDSYDGNCHNSFIQLHAYNGVGILIGFVYLLFNVCYKYIKNRKYLFVAMVFVICIRGMTDKFIFGQYGMPIVLYLVLFPIFYPSCRKIKNIH